ncbi:MAG: phospholipase [Muribaculaceae bacterium]|nr:phospholipase [Muribaculaceae bacterium]
MFILSGRVVAAGVALYVHDRLWRRNRPSEPEPAPDDSDQSECCGMHITCERDSLLASVSAEAEYFDDEELDRFAGREPQSYTAAETEEFRDVLLTLLPSDIAPWARSIQLRGITLPDEVREELLLIVAEARQQQSGNTSNLTS